MAESLKSRYRIPMLERSMRTLELLADAPDGLSIAELSRLLDAPKSSVFNILATLEQTGYIRALNGTGKHVLTAKLYRLGTSVVARLNLKQLLYPFLAGLVAETGETANLGVLQGDEAFYIESIEGHARLRVAVAAGERIELHCTALGKVLIAYAPAETALRLLKLHKRAAHTPKTVTSLKALQAQLALVRQLGYALDDEEDNLDIRCIGAPIRDHSGQVVAAVSLTAPKHRLTDAAIASMAAQVTTWADRMSHALGYDERMGSALHTHAVPAPVRARPTLPRGRRRQ